MDGMKMNDMFALISLSFADTVTVDAQALSLEMQELGLGQGLVVEGAHPVTLPQFTFAGNFPSGDRADLHRKLHRGLNVALKRLNMHGSFFILVSPDTDWSCCHF